MTILTHEQIISLSPADRLALIGELWDSLEERDLPLTVAQEIEMKRRLETLEEDRKHAVTWEAIKAKMASQ